MKAEHRKELETNVLADRMGRAVQGLKKAPQRWTLVWLVVGGIVLGVVLLVMRGSEVRQAENSLHWLEFEDGAGLHLQKLVEQDPQSNQAKAAHFEIAYALLRQALQRLATDPKQTLSELDKIESTYRELAKLCKDDKVLLPEALFAQAVIEETRIMREDDKWKDALAAYKEVAENHKDSAVAKFARRRIKVLDNKEERDNLLNIYRDLRLTFVRDDGPLLPEFPPLTRPPMPAIPGPEAPK